MRFKTATSPHHTPFNSVQNIMLQVLLAMIPGIAATVYFFGWGVLINITLACIVALICESTDAEDS